jgi:hypothetical protein
MKEQVGYTGKNNNDVLRFRNFNPINQGTMDAMDKIKSIRTKDVITINKDVFDWEDDVDHIETEEDDSDDPQNGEIIDDGEPDPLSISGDSDVRGSTQKYNSYPFGFVGAPMAIGNSMSEKVGSPNSIEPWVDLIFNILRNQLLVFVDHVRNTDEYDIIIEIEGKDHKSKSLVFNHEKEKINKYIKNHIPKGDDLKVKDMSIEIGVSILPDEVYNFDTWNASFKDINSYINNSIYHDVELLFEIHLPESILEVDSDEVDDFISKNGIYDKVRSMVSHEVTHLYEYYKRKLNNISSWKDRLVGTNKVLVEKQLISNISSDWKHFLNLVYLSLDYEINARVSQLYYELSDKDIETKYDFMNFIKSAQVWEEKEMVKNFNAKEFIENFSYKSSDEDLKSVFRTLDIYTEEQLQTYDIKNLLLKELISIWNRSIDHTNDLYDDFDLRKLKPGELQSPIRFFKNFEKKFHKKADKWERKIYKLYSRID